MTNFDKVKEIFCEEFTIPKFATENLEYNICDAINRIRDRKTGECKFDCNECYKWLKQEYKPQILDKVEKKYLSNIIRPFRDKVDGIMKPNRIFDPIECKYVLDGREYIVINIKNEANINLPFFKEGTMYKGMEAGKPYTLEELGI